MKIVIQQVNIITREDRRAVGLRASLRICLDDAVVIDRCALCERDGVYILKPPMGKTPGEKPVRWQRDSAFEKELLAAALDAYEAMTDAG